MTITNEQVGSEIKELLSVILTAEKIDCTCNKKQIAQGKRCGCQKGQAVFNAGQELGNYLRILKEELK